MNIHIKKGRLIDPRNGIDSQSDLYIAEGKIATIGNPPPGFVAEEVIDAEGLIVCPGLIDLSARLREPGYEHKATLESEMHAAVAGGITSLVCPPDTDPVLDEPGLVEMLKHKAKQLHLANVYPLGALTRKLQGQELTEMSELREAGCVGFSQADNPIIDTQVLWRAMQYAATFGYTVWLRPEEHYLAKGGVAHSGEIASRLGLKGIPTAAETLAIATLLHIATETGARIHLCRISTAEGVEMVRAAKAQGLQVTCDISINHLHLTEHDIGFFDGNCHLRPPLRSHRDRTALQQAIAEGVVDAICSDHTPVDEDEKLRPFAETEAGATGLELLLPLTLKWAQEGNVALPEALARITSAAADILGISAGDLSPDVDANVCVFDPEQEWKVEAQALTSQGKNTPYMGLPLVGKVKYTLVSGKVVFQVN